MANTRDTMGEQACLDALVADTLTSFEDDGVSKVGPSCLYRKNTLVDVTLPQCKSIYNSGMSNCLNLESVDMLGTGTIDSSAFYGDKKLKHLVLRGLTKTTLYSYTAFTDTPISTGDGAIYVDSSLLAQYKADNNWKDFYITTLDKYPLSVFETIEDDWATIIAKAEAGTASQSYSIGDTKLIDLGNQGQVYAQIAAFNADPLASDGTKTAGITFITKQVLATKRIINSYSYSENGDWEHSDMRSYLSSTILPLLPSVLQSGIKEVTKYSDYFAQGASTVTHDQATTDKLWIPSARETVGGSSYEQTGPVYSGLFTNSNSLKKSDGTSFVYWWLRSASATNYYRHINNSGAIGNTTSSTAQGIALGFCV